MGENHEKESDSSFISVLHHQNERSWLQDNLIYATSKNNYTFTALEDNLFLPRGSYIGDDGLPVMFIASDFIGKITLMNKVMNGLGATASVVGEGIVLWSFRDDFGVLKKVRLNAYCVPANKARFFSPQFYFQQEAGSTFSMNVDESVFNFSNGGVLSFKYSGSLLPIAHASMHIQTSSAGYLASIGRKNIFKAQEELLLWHATLGHYNITNM